jgi:iron complex transport system substrate-binding protein
MKKLFSTTAMFIVSLALIAGCGQSNNDLVNIEENKTLTQETTTQNSENTKPSEETKAKETKVVKTEKGDVEIPVNPTRVVIQSYVGDVLSLGVKPVGGDMEPTLFDSLLENFDYQKLDNFDPENVMALEPDLIILQEGSKNADYDALSQIAPTIILKDIEMTTEERVLYLGEILGKQEEAKKAIDTYTNLANENKQKLIAAGIENKTITIMEGSYLFGSKYGRGADVAYNYLGFTAPDKLQKEFDAGNLYMEVSMEVLNEYCGDYILVSVYEGAEDWSDNEVWNNIEAVKNKNVIEIDFNQFYARDIYVMSKQMNYITEALLSTVNK